MRQNNILYMGDDSEVVLPTRWVICPACDGNGTSCAHVECDGGGFTSSEWNEQDEDFRDDYLAGRYDRPCDECSGSGKVKVVDTDRLTEEQLALWNEQCDDDADYDAMCRAERRMGC